MDNQESIRQIAKFKARKSKSRLAHFGALISLFILFSILGNEFSFNSLFSGLIFIPIPLYFVRESIKLSSKLKLQKQIVISMIKAQSTLHSTFSFAKFISQPSWSFRLSLALILLIFFTTIARIRVAHSTLTYETPITTHN